MSVLYEIRIIDNATAGFGTACITTPERTMFFTIREPEEAIEKLRRTVNGGTKTVPKMREQGFV